MKSPDEVSKEPVQDYVDCAIVVVTYNSARYITGLLSSLPAAAEGLRLRIVVVDNGSADDTVLQVREHPEVVCIEAGTNLGYAAGINVGRRQVGEYKSLAVLNPDLVLDPGALRVMFAALEDNPAVGMVVPMLLDFDGDWGPSLGREPTILRAIGDALLGGRFKSRPAWLSEIVRNEREYGYRHSVDWATGAAMLMSAACDEAVGSWDERFFLYSEEVDYATRVRAAGYRIDYLPEAKARHRKAGSGQSHALIALKAVSRIRYFEKHGKPARLMRAAVLLHELLRAADPSHRSALSFVWRRSSWEPLISGLKLGSKEPLVSARSLKA